jgi:hypothetical protein
VSASVTVLGHQRWWEIHYPQLGIVTANELRVPSARQASPRAPQELVVQAVADGTTAILIILAMTFGLFLPKMCIEHFYPGFAKLNPRS